LLTANTFNNPPKINALKKTIKVVVKRPIIEKPNNQITKTYQ